MKPSKYTFFTSLLCASGLSAGLCFCVMTSFAVPADGLSLVCACVLAALLFSALLLLPKSWVWLLTVAALAGGGLYIVALGSAAILIAVQCVLHLKCRLFTVKKYVRIRVCFEGESHCSEITALFGAEHFSKLSAERRDGAVLCTGTVTTAEDVTEAELADILAANEFIRSIERCDDE